MDIQLGPAQRSHGCSRVEFHGAGAQRNHRMCQGDILALQFFDVAHEFRLGMILRENPLRQYRGGSAQGFRDAGRLRRCMIRCRHPEGIQYRRQNIPERALTGSLGKDAQQGANVGQCGRLIGTEAYPSGRIIPEVDVLLQGATADLFLQRPVGTYRKGIEETSVHQFITQIPEAGTERHRQTVHP